MKKSKIVKIGLLMAVFFSIFGCKVIEYVPIETGTSVHVKDSTIFHIKDSIRVIPIERYVDIVRPVDTLTLETSLAKATAYYDSTFNVLRGEIHNKKQVEEKTRIIYKDKLVYRDSIRIEEIPVPVEKIIERKVIPRFWRFFGILGIILSCLLLFKVYLKVKEKFL